MASFTGPGRAKVAFDYQRLMASFTVAPSTPLDITSRERFTESGVTNLALDFPGGIATIVWDKPVWASIGCTYLVEASQAGVTWSILGTTSDLSWPIADGSLTAGEFTSYQFRVTATRTLP
jgi:hypothetical protein